MKTLILSILFFAVAQTSFSMTVSQRVRHMTDLPMTGLGCSQVRFKVIYNTGSGMDGIVYSNSVNMNSGSVYDFSVTIPDGATIVSKTVQFNFVGGNSYNYIITGTNNSPFIQYTNCSCPTIASKILMLTETTGKSAELQFYHTSTVGGDC